MDDRNLLFLYDRDVGQESIYHRYVSFSSTSMVLY